MREVAESVRERFGQSYDALKFWQELGWRQFWQLVYAWLGNRIYEDLEPAKVNLGGSFPEELPEEIQQGKTGLVCMDESVRELVETGYMHNHARMWFASFVIHFRKLGWKAGERFLYRHLLDGDPASNALSWQWVASLSVTVPIFLIRRTFRKTGGRSGVSGATPSVPLRQPTRSWSGGSSLREDPGMAPRGFPLGPGSGGEEISRGPAGFCFRSAVFGEGSAQL